jgi:glycosyltransferase involved in cell wall biosynthesis
VPFPNHGPRSILFAGRMVPKKGASDLLLAAKELIRRGAEFRVNLVGAGPLSEYLKYQARLLGIDTKIRFHGLVDPDQMPCFYRDNHFLVLPSLQEPFGMAAV